MNILDDVKQIIKDATSVVYEDVNIEENTDLLTDLGFDSISLMQLIVELESHFSIEFDYSLQFEDINTVKKLANYIESFINQH